MPFLTLIFTLSTSAPITTFEPSVLRADLAKNIHVAMNCADQNPEVFHQAFRPIIQTLFQLRTGARGRPRRDFDILVDSVLAEAIADVRRDSPQALHKLHRRLASQLAWESSFDPGSWSEYFAHRETEAHQDQTLLQISMRAGAIGHLLFTAAHIPLDEQNAVTLAAAAILTNAVRVFSRARRFHRQRRPDLIHVLQACQRALVR